MKNLLFLFTLTALCLSVFTSPAQADKKEITEEQAAKMIQERQAVVADLEKKLEAVNADVEAAKKELEDTKNNLTDCNEALLKLLGATKEDVEAFRQKLGKIRGQVRDMQRLSDDVLADRQDDVMALEAKLNELRGAKLALIPEFYNEILKLAKDINPGLIREKKIKSYTVGTWAENRDCLWNIAGKIEIYGDPFQWPKIWQANTGIIRNPDIIHPGQVLVLPEKGAKSSDELKAERRYWRQKKEAMEADGTMEEATKGQ